MVASRSAGVVSVALTPPDGNRRTVKVPSDTTLWRILRKIESTDSSNLNFTARGVTEVASGSSGAGRIVYEMPTLNLNSRECATFGDLQKTLRQLGYNNGTASIRLGFKKTEQPLEEAMKEIGEYFKEEEALEESGSVETTHAPESASNITDAVAQLGSEEPTVSHQQDTGADSQEPSKDTPSDAAHYTEPIADASLPTTPAKRSAPVSSSDESPPLQLNNRRIEAFLAPSSGTPRAALAPHNEADFEPTLGHLKSVQNRLQSTTHNKRLPSDAEIAKQEEEQAARLAAVKELRIKIKLADQSTAIATLYTTDHAATLYELVRSAIVAEGQPFKLVYLGNKGPRTVVPDDPKAGLIKKLGFSERMVVNFVWGDGVSESVKKAPALKPEILAKAKALQVPQAVNLEPKDGESGSSAEKGKGKESQGGGKEKGKMPAWLKLGKK